jgi:hypothetical protein
VDVLFELALNDRLGGFARTKAGNPGLADELLELLLEAGVDVFPSDRDLDVLLARTDVPDIDGLLDLFLFLGRRLGIGFGFRRGLGSISHDANSLKSKSMPKKGDRTRFQRKGVLTRMALPSVSYFSEANYVNPRFPPLARICTYAWAGLLFFPVRRLSARSCLGPRTFHATPRTPGPAVGFLSRL